MVENVLWPAYFDAELTRSEGRRVPKELAVEKPTVDEIADAVQQVGYDAVIERDKTYSRVRRTRPCSSKGPRTLKTISSRRLEPTSSSLETDAAYWHR